MNEIIKEFRGEYSFLSNFYALAVRLTMGGEFYPTVEHAYQAAKTTDLNQRKFIREARTPKIAKQLGGGVTLREDWEMVKVAVMGTLVLQKFSKNLDLRSRLLATGDAILEEGNWWGDNFWGMFRGKGKNHLGKILMQVRETIRNA